MAKEEAATTRRIVAGADGFGSDLKSSLVAYLKEKDVEVVDLGVDKYYSIAAKVASELAKEKKKLAASASPEEEGPLSRGLLVCGTGVGMSIFANKFDGVYAASCNSVDEALNARSINTNVLALGAKIASVEEGKKILDAWLETPFKAPCPASDGCPWNSEIDQFLDASIEEMERISQAGLENREKPSPASPRSCIDLRKSLLETITLAPSLDDTRSSVSHSEARAGVGLGLTAIHAPISAPISGSDSRLRAGVGTGLTPIHAPISSQLSTAVSMSELDGQLELLETKEVSAEDPQQQQSLEERGADEEEEKAKHECSICGLASTRDFESVSIMRGGSWKILRQDPTSAVVRFKAGSVEPAHHHTFGHDLIVTSGKKTVWNLTTTEKFDLQGGDFLYTPAGDVHRVQYHEDTEFFIRWDGHWDILLDEDVEAAKAALDITP